MATGVEERILGIFSRLFYKIDLLEGDGLKDIFCRSNFLILLLIYPSAPHNLEWHLVKSTIRALISINIVMFDVPSYSFSSNYRNSLGDFEKDELPTMMKYYLVSYRSQRKHYL